MPKKRDKKSGEIDDKTKKKSSSTTPDDKKGFDEKEKDLYLTQIEYLTEELDRFQLKCDELTKENRNFIRVEAEKKDIIECLKHSILEKEEELEQLLERLENQQRAASQNRGALQVKHNQLMTELQKQIDKLHEQNRTLDEKLADLEEFQRQKEELMTNTDHLKKQLEHQEEEHKDEIHKLEIKVLLEKKRLEEEMESRTVAMAAKVQHLVEQSLTESTRTVLQENVEMKSFLSQLSEQVHILMEENTALREHKSQLTIDVEILEQTVRETSRTNCYQKKEMQQLTGRCQQLQEELKNKHQQLQQLQTEHSQVLAEMKALRAENSHPGLRSQIRLDHHTPGNSSIVSRPTSKPKSALCRTGAGSRSTSVPLYRKPVGQKTTSSVKQTQSAVGFLTSEQLFNKLKWS